MMTSSSSKKHGVDVLVIQRMLDACASITKAALSCPTLGSFVLAQISNDGGEEHVDCDAGRSCDVTNEADTGNDRGSTSLDKNDELPRHPPSAEVSAEYTEEIEISIWLESQIAEYRAALQRLEEEEKLELEQAQSKPSSSGVAGAAPAAAAPPPPSAAAVPAGSGGSNTNLGFHHKSTSKKRSRSSEVDETLMIKRRKEQELKRLREDVFDETVRVQQERLLISRLRMAAAAVYTSFPDFEKHTAIKTRIGGKPNGAAVDDEGDEEEEIHAARLRREALHSRDEEVVSVLGKRQDLDRLRDRLESANEECREWQNRNRELWQRLTINNRDEETETNTDEDELRRENVVLKRALSEAIATSGIDWYGDESLLKIMQKLEE